MRSIAVSARSWLFAYPSGVRPPGIRAQTLSQAPEMESTPPFKAKCGDGDLSESSWRIAARSVLRFIVGFEASSQGKLVLALMREFFDHGT
jgi:hypothetical protein